MIRFIDAAQVDALLDYPGLISALEAGHRAGVDGAERLVMTQPASPETPQGSGNHFLVWPAWQHGQALGVKLVTSYPENTSQGRPTVQGVYVLFDGQSGAPSALIDGAAMTPWKTAADSALGARYLAPQAAQRLLMVGAGVMAPHLIRAHLVVRPSIGRVEIWNRNGGRAEALARSLQLEGLSITATDELEPAARRADVISCATGAKEPLIRGAWLKPGCHLDLVGGFTTEMREADDEACRRARVFVDTRWFTLGQCGDLAGPMASGALRENDIGGDLFELCRGETKGRQSESDITLFKNAGGSHLDLMTARHIVAQAAGD